MDNEYIASESKVLISTISSMSNYGITYDAATESFTYEANALKKSVSFVPPIINHRLLIQGKPKINNSNRKNESKINNNIVKESEEEVEVLSKEERQAQRLLNLPKDF